MGLSEQSRNFWLFILAREELSTQCAASSARRMLTDEHDAVAQGEALAGPIFSCFVESG
jgi:hypothetical protein